MRYTARMSSTVRTSGRLSNVETGAGWVIYDFAWKGAAVYGDRERPVKPKFTAEPTVYSGIIRYFPALRTSLTRRPSDHCSAVLTQSYILVLKFGSCRHPV